AGQQALALATGLGDLAWQVAASNFLGTAYYSIGDYGRAAELYRRNVEALERSTGRPDLQIQSQAWLAFIFSHLGQFAEGRSQGEEALRHATAGGLGVNPRLPTFFLGRLYLA